MPQNTPVERCYQKLKGEKGKSSAAAICQHATKRSLRNNEPIKGSERKFSDLVPYGRPKGK